MKNILIINGPNLNWVGRREPAIYGNDSLESYLEDLKKGYTQGILTFVFTNIEGEIIDKLQHAEISDEFEGVIINAGGYSHTSIAISDTIRAMKKPVIAVHISNTFDRREERLRDLVAAACNGFVGGFGLNSYDIALRYFEL